MQLSGYKYFKELYFAFYLLVVVLAVGTIGYVVIADYTWLDAFYMTVITASTVGFAEVEPLDASGKLFTAFLIITTFGSFAYTLSVITRYLVSGEYRLFIKNYRVMKKLSQMNGHVIVCGYGRNGKQAAQTLRAHNQQFVVIESDPDIVNHALENESDVPIIEGDATDDRILEKVNIESTRALIATLPKDAENLFIVLSAKQLNQNLKVISRASDDRSENKLKMAGADNVILPDKVGGSHMATLVITPDLMEFLDHISLQGPDESTLVEITFSNLPKDFEDKSIFELEKRYRTGARIIGFKTPDNQIIVNPSSETELVPGSKLFVLGNPEQIKKLKEALNIDD
ncbi:MAG: potassium channel protein [Salibacteraceae bacterium]